MTIRGRLLDKETVLPSGDPPESSTRTDPSVDTDRPERFAILTGFKACGIPSRR
jgi:hypothetical protein